MLSKQLLCLAMAASGCASAAAETLVLTATRDNSLFGPIDGDLSSGGGPHIFVGRTSGNSGGNNLRRGLVRFDVSEIPTGSTIVSAKVRMQIVWRPQNAAYPVTTSLHRCTADWGEGDSNSPGGAGVPAAPGDATWTDRFHPDVAWATPGGDFDTQPSSGVSVIGAGPYIFEGDGVAADVQSWVDGEPNFGWILVGDESVPSSAARWVSRENVAPTLHPILTVEFELPETVRFLRPAADGTLIGPASDDLASGVGWSLRSGRTSGASGADNLRRALLKFDLSEIPEGATVTSANLRMEVWRRPPGGPAAVVQQLHRCTADWGEGGSNSPGGGGAPAEPGDATWTDRFYPEVSWDSPGGDFDAVPSGTVTVEALGPQFFAGDGVLADVQSWIDGAPNFGWIVIGDESTPRTATAWLSREYFELPKTPRLAVEFELPPSNPFDLTGDGIVGPGDLSQLLGSWGACEDCPADFNQDGFVDASDLAQLIGNWDSPRP